MPESAHRLAYDESVRAITGQANVLDTIRARAGTLLAAASLVTSVLGGQALVAPEARDGIVVRTPISTWGWLAIAAFIGVGVLTLAILWPYRWRFEQSAKSIIRVIEKPGDVVTPAEAERELALRHELNFNLNRVKLDRLFWCFRLTCVLITLEAIAWIIDVRS